MRTLSTLCYHLYLSMFFGQNLYFSTVSFLPRGLLSRKILNSARSQRSIQNECLNNGLRVQSEIVTGSNNFKNYPVFILVIRTYKIVSH